MIPKEERMTEEEVDLMLPVAMRAINYSRDIGKTAHLSFKPEGKIIGRFEGTQVLEEIEENVEGFSGMFLRSEDTVVDGVLIDPREGGKIYFTLE